jgi:hypothetical protein
LKRLLQLRIGENRPQQTERVGLRRYGRRCRSGLRRRSGQRGNLTLLHRLQERRDLINASRRRRVGGGRWYCACRLTRSRRGLSRRRRRRHCLRLSS